MTAPATGVARVLLAAACLAAAAAGCGPSATGPRNPADEKAPPAGDIPDVALEKAGGGGTVGLRALAQGKVLIVAFWATWCESCKGELVGLKGFFDEHKGKGLEVAAVSVDTPDTAGEVMSEAHRFSLPFTVLLDTESRASSAMNPSGTVPFLVVYDRAARKVYAHEGYLAGDLDAIKKAALDALGE